MRYLFLLLSVFIMSCFCDAKTICDSVNCNLHLFFNERNTKYVIRNNHIFNDTIIIPSGSELFFDGGNLAGPIIFVDTKLSGKVSLKGASISGKISNKRFNASWLCKADGKTDDAKSINEIIRVCDEVFFPCGKYRLISKFDTHGKEPDNCQLKIKTHISIDRSNIYMYGEKGTVFITDRALCTICVLSDANKIEESVRNIKIKGITFDVRNDGETFHEFVHTIKLVGVDGLIIEECTFKDFWGDAITLGHYGDNLLTGERTRNQNILITKNTILGGNHHNNRNGISVVSGKNVVIKKNVIKNTTRKDMPGGIDVEPNNSAYTIENIRIEGNYLEGITGTGGAISVQSYKDGPAHHIEILSNEIKNCSKAGIAIRIKSEGMTDSFVIKDNYIHADTRPFFFRGNGMSKDWTISGNTFGRPILESIPGEIAVENLVVRNNKKKE